MELSTVLKNMDFNLIYYLIGQKISLHCVCFGFLILNLIKDSPDFITLLGH